ncbi:helix-turn-helix transcriptional regulator [Halosegnis longus]|uniref:ArsR family transcriptional regulator n=1 Tax=Halosegnis longus TaxID=2216012 RepID=A0AAJ4R7N5_9EURY|nr:winged helix-turn-helix domain-containing protein [Halosegnis longus]RNJ26058.1 ArsR family transcriptional regulator [Salella cibi]
MTEPLEAIEFLARSPNRVAVLRAVADAPHSRRDLREATGASQPTLTRIIRDFEEHDWIRRTDEGYVATPLGGLLADGFADLLTVVETEQHLRDVAPWLPTDDLDIDLTALHDATITRPTTTDPSGPLKRALELTADARQHRILSYALNRDMVERLHAATVEGTQQFEAVVTDATIEPLRDAPALWAKFRAVADSDSVSIRVADQPVSFAMGVADDTVYFLLRDDGEVLRALVESEDGRVLGWAHDTFERYWATASPLDV